MMRLRYWSAFLAAAALGAAVPASAAALTKAEIDARWQRLTAAQEARAVGEAKAAELRRTLDGQVLEGSLYSLWRRCVRGEASRRLQAAWSVLRVHVPGGDPSRWDEVGSFELPSETPRAFMVIDALYAALIELRRRRMAGGRAAARFRALAARALRFSRRLSGPGGRSRGGYRGAHRAERKLAAAPGGGASADRPPGARHGHRLLRARQGHAVPRRRGHPGGQRILRLGPALGADLPHQSARS